MAWITLNVVCCVEDLEAEAIERANVILEAMALPLKELPPPIFEEREAEIQIHNIVTYYASNQKGKTVIECINSSYSAVIEKKALKLMIAKAEGSG